MASPAAVGDHGHLEALAVLQEVRALAPDALGAVAVARALAHQQAMLGNHELGRTGDVQAQAHGFVGRHLLDLRKRELGRQPDAMRTQVGKLIEGGMVERGDVRARLDERALGICLEQLPDVVGEDRFFGELGLIEKLPRTATVVSLENGTILNRITDESLDEMFSSHPAIILKLLRHISSRLRKLTLDYVKACRTVTRMIAEEEGRPQLTEEDLQRIEEAVLMAQISSNAYWY